MAMPALSATLRGPKDPRRCQSCGTAHSKRNPLERWIECDAYDRRQPNAPRVVLCSACAKRLIDPHPRLYLQAITFAAIEGCMGVCVECRYRDGTSCTNPRTADNGGGGLDFGWEKPPARVHLYYGGKRGGRWTTLYSGPVLSCSGREVLTQEEK
jgi:hypothetical protein